MPNQNQNNAPQGNQNNNTQNNGAVNVVQEEEKQIIDQSKNQIEPTTPVFGTNSFKYRTAKNNTKRTKNAHTFSGKLRAKFAPFREWLYQYRLVHEASGNKHRKFWYSFAFFFGLFWLLDGIFFWHAGTVINQTPIGQKKVFINGDTEKMSSVHYDKNNHMALVYLTMGGFHNTGFPTHNVKASFKFYNPPKSYSGAAPTVQLLPLYQDHYVAIFRHIYNGSGAISLQLQDMNKFNPNDLSQSVQQDNGSDKPGQPTMGADILTKPQVQLIGVPQAQLNAKEVNIQDKLIGKLQAHNYQKNIISTRQLRNNPGKINEHLSTTQILAHIFRKVIHHNQTDLNLRHRLIKQTQNRLKTDNKHLHGLYKNAALSASSTEMSSAHSHINDDKREIALYQKEAKFDQTAINQARQRLAQATSGVINNTTPLPQNRDQAWNSVKE